MPKFKVLCRVDAFADYVAEVEADSPEEAAWIADSTSGLDWQAQGVVEFDKRLFVALDDRGEPLEATQCGDF